MSSNRKNEGIQAKPWRDVIHDFKNKINPAVIIAESFLNDLHLQAEKSAHNILLALFQTLQEIHKQNILDWTAYRNIEPDPLIIEEKIKLYQGLLGIALEKAHWYLKNKNRDNIDERSAADVMIQSIKSAQIYLNPGQNTKTLTLQELVKKNILSHNFALRQKNNSIRLFFSPPEANPKIKSEYINYLDSILENCLANSNRFTMDGEITVQIQLEEKEGKFRIIIKDTGEGMPPAILERVRQGEVGVTKGGNGIGLAGVYGMTRQYGGTLTIDSSTDSVNHGSTFTFELPASLILEDNNRLLATVSSTASAEVGKNKEREANKPYSIYFIDDIAINRKLFPRAMAPLMKNRPAIRVVAIADPVEIINMDKEEIEKIIGVITDVNLANDVNGIKFASEQIYPRLKGKVPIFSYSGDNVELMPDGKITGHIIKGAGLKTALEHFFELVDKAVAEKTILTLQSTRADSTASGSAALPTFPLIGASSRSISLPSYKLLKLPKPKFLSRSSTEEAPSRSLGANKLFTKKKEIAEKMEVKFPRLIGKKPLKLSKINLSFSGDSENEASSSPEKKTQKLSKKTGTHK